MLKELIDQFYLDRERARSGDQTRFYITDAGKCPRAVFFKFKKAPKEEIAARVLRMFDHGDYIHRLIMNTLESLKEVRVVASEVNIRPGELIAGRADAIISDGTEQYVLDIKSMNSMVFKNLDRAKDENINQLQLYLHFFKILKGILLYVNKDSQELKEFIVEYNPTITQKLLKDLDSLKIKIEKNIIPSRIASWPDDWQCKYCAFREICGLSNGGEVSWEEFKKKIQIRDATHPPPTESS